MSTLDFPNALKSIMLGHNTAHFRSMKRRPFARVIPIPLLLSAVAVYQMHLVQSARQTPWKGGGFGMFSSVVTPDSRILRLYQLTDMKAVPLLPPEGQQRRITAVLASPTVDRTTLMVRNFLKTGWMNDNSDPILVEVWQETFDGRNATIALEPLLELKIARNL